MKTVMMCVMILLIVFSASMALTAELVDVGLQKQLLVDDYVIDHKENITRKFHKAQKKGGVMRPSVLTDFSPKLWNKKDKLDANGIPTIMVSDHMGYRTTVYWNERENKFQMMYRGGKEAVTGYAESRDGYNWVKPIISQGEKDDKYYNFPSNLIEFKGKVHRSFFEATFTVDPTLPWGHPEKYKAAFNPGPAWDCEAAIAHSPDGIHWTGYNNGEPVTGRAADTANQLFWDPIGKRYILVTREDKGAKGGYKENRSTRIMVHSKGNDLNKYPKAWETIAIVSVDHPKGERTEHGVAKYQVEAMTIWPYENIYFGLMRVLRVGTITGARGEDMVVNDVHGRPASDVIDFFLATSRDCVNFDRTWIYEDQPFVERGGRGEFDKAKVMAASTIVTKDDKHWIYYSGDYNQHHAEMSSAIKDQPVRDKIGLAQIPLDRFISQSAGSDLGTIITKPFKLYGNKLICNVDGSNGGFYVEILDVDGKPINSYTAADCRKYMGADSLRLPISWKKKRDISALKGKIICLKFYLQNAELYSFQVK